MIQSILILLKSLVIRGLVRFSYFNDISTDRESKYIMNDSQSVIIPKAKSIEDVM